MPCFVAPRMLAASGTFKGLGENLGISVSQDVTHKENQHLKGSEKLSECHIFLTPKINRPTKIQKNIPYTLNPTPVKKIH